MKHRRTVTMLAGAPLLLAASLGTGCAKKKEVTTTPETPPAPHYESISDSPGPGYGWIGGKWVWTGKKKPWHEVGWEDWPIPNGRWVPGHWRETKDGREWVEGHWK